MTKQTYSDEEIKQAFHALLIEKKKVRELEQQIDDLQGRSNASSSEEVQKLKQLLFVFKKKYQETATELENTKQVQPTSKLSDSLIRIHELESNLENQKESRHEIVNLLRESTKEQELLKGRYLKLEEENERLKGNIINLKSDNQIILDKLTQENRHLKNHLSEVEELRHKIDSSHKEQERKIVLIEELTKQNHTLKEKNEELSGLKEQVKYIRDEADQYKAICERMKREIAIFNEKGIEVESLKKSLAETQAELYSLREVSRYLKEQTEENEALSQQIRKTTQDAITYKANFEKVNEENHQLHTNLLELGRAAEEAALGRIQIEELKKQLQLHIEENASLKSQLHTLEGFQREHQALRSHAEELKLTLHEVQDQHQRQKQRIEKFGTALQEKDRRIGELQQFEYSHKKFYEQKLELQHQLDQERHGFKLCREDLERKEKALTESQQHAEQLERVIQFLRERSEEAHLEANQLKEEYQISQENALQLSQQIQVQVEQIETQKKQLNEEKARCQEASDEVEALQKQFETLRTKIDEQNTQLELQQKAIDSHEEIKQTLEKEKDHLNEIIKQKNTSLERQEKEIEVVKQTLVRGLREAKELEARYLDAVNEKVSALNKFHQIQQQLELHREELRVLRMQLSDSQSKEAAFKQRIDEIRKSLSDQHEQALNAFHHEKERLKAEYQHRERNVKQEVEQLGNQLAEAHRRTLLEMEEEIAQQKAELARQRHKDKEEFEALKYALEAETSHKIAELKKELQDLRQEQSEKDEQMKVAQQHLVKKVKEASLLTEKMDEKESQLTELQASHQKLAHRNEELQHNFESEVQQNKRLQDQLNELLVNHSHQLARCEEKYTQAMERVNSLEFRNKELQKLEEKHAQMQALLSNLGSFIGGGTTPPPAPQSQPPLQSAPLQQTAINPVPIFGEMELVQSNETEKTEEDAPKARPYQNLFDMPKPPSKPKQNFFD